MVVQKITDKVELTLTQAERKPFSPFLAALLLAILLDAWFGSAHPLSHTTTVNLDRSEVFYAFPSFVKDAKNSNKPKVIFLGSSVLLQPVMVQEATYLNSTIRPFEHRKLASLGEYSKKHPNNYIPNGSDFFCLAMGGEMASDAYLLLCKAISSGVKPRTVVFTVAPRDFQCNSVPSVISTPMYQLYSSLTDVPQIASINELSTKEVIDFTISRISSLYKYREDVAKYLWLRARKLVDRISPIALFEKIDSLGHKHVQKIGVFADDVPGVITLGPAAPMAHRSVEETVIEYRHHYDPIDLKRYGVQLFYFSKLADTCQTNDISLIVVNMPLSRKNRNLIPAGFYSRYLNDLQETCSKKNAAFIDLQAETWDDDSNYTDTVHIRPTAVPRFIDELFSAFATIHNAGINPHPVRQTR